MSKRPELLKFAFVVTPATGSLWCAHLKDDNTIVAHGETPVLAIRNLCEHLAEEDARTYSDKDARS